MRKSRRINNEITPPRMELLISKVHDGIPFLPYAEAVILVRRANVAISRVYGLLGGHSFVDTRRLVHNKTAN